MPTRRRGIVRPVLGWLVVSSILFLWQHHRTQARQATMQFAVAIEGRGGQVVHEATLNGVPYHTGEPCGVGWKKLVIRAKNAEPFETNFFGWYEGASLGNISLKRSRGNMDLTLSPSAETVRITGAEEQKNLTNRTHESLSLPTGHYKVEATFARFRVEQSVEVTRNQTTQVAIVPDITSLNLSSEPGKAEFELQSAQWPDISVKGTTPTAIPDLPAGEYQLAIKQGDYRKNQSFTLSGLKATNEMKVEFRYGKLSFISEPPEANISHGGKVIGQTPTRLELPPGSYRFHIEKDGYFGTNVSVTLSETDSRTVSVKLINVSFVEALERAQQQMSRSSPDYEVAFAAVETALLNQPNNETALQLKRTIEFHLHLQNGRQFLRTGELTKALVEADAALKLKSSDADALALQAEIEKGLLVAAAARAKAKEEAAAAEVENRRNRPLRVLQQITRGMKHHELFSVQMLSSSKTMDAMQADVVRALGKKPEWNISSSKRLTDGTRVIQAEASGTGWMQTVVLVMGQATDEEVRLQFKLFVFVVGEGAESGFFKPLHPDHVTTMHPNLIAEHLARDLRNFQKRLEEEIR